MTPLLMWMPVVAYCFGVGISEDVLTFFQSLTLACTGIFIWTLSEYLLHRFVFHFTPNGPIQERIAFLIHGVHHEDPADERRLLMPPVAGAIIAAAFYGLFELALGSILVKPFFAGFIFGYLCYDYTHFAVHFWAPKSEHFKRLKHNHMIHHFVSPEARYGVSNTLWDHVFGTRKETAKAAHAQRTHGQPSLHP